MNIADVRQFDKAAFERAYERLRVAPLDLTESDFAQLAIVSTSLETDGREAQRQAQLAIVHKHSPSVQTKQLPASGSRALTVKHVEEFGGVMIDIIAKSVLPLKDQIHELKARVLELEAQAAARSVAPDGDLTR